MVIAPKVRGFLCTTAHPLGCAENVRRQVEYVRGRGPVPGAPRRVLVVGASTGYGLAARIAAAFGGGGATLGVFFEKEVTPKRTATAGWYNSAAFHRLAEEAGLYAKSINGDAFSSEVKEAAIETIRADLGQVDLVVYSLAAPRRRHPVTGEVFQSVLKPVGKVVRTRGIDTDREVVEEVTLEPATEEEVRQTVAVMGGEDWQLWIEALDRAGVLAPGAKTCAFTYIGERITWDIYWHGTIGAAKQDLDRRVVEIRRRLAERGGDARVAVLKAVVTQASAAIPIMPLYLALLYKEMKARGTHEGPIEQIDRLFRECLYAPQPRLDAEGRLRVDDRELDPEVQGAVEALWNQVTTENLHKLTDYAGYKRDFLRLFGFEVEGVDYAADVDPVVPIPGLIS